MLTCKPVGGALSVDAYILGQFIRKLIYTKLYLEFYILTTKLVVNLRCSIATRSGKHDTMSFKGAYSYCN